jgi:tetratricopeptide (TPR) repeat protein
MESHERPGVARLPRIRLRRAALAVLLVSAQARAQSGGEEHLLTGAQYFRSERYREALVEFRVAERSGAGGVASWYVASTLVKLGRPEDAITVFAQAEASAAQDRDALFDYYHALACYDAKLYGCADRLLAGIGSHAGPRIAAQARTIRGDLAAVMSAAPSTGSIDWYSVRGRRAEEKGSTSLAIAYYDEALRLSVLRADGYGRVDTAAALNRLRVAKKATVTSPRRPP